MLQGDPFCQVCSSAEFTPIFDNVLKKCTSCGHICANMEITPEVLEKAYREEYFKGAEYSDYESDKESLQDNFRRRLKFVFKKVPAEKITSVLELGAAYGYFGEELKRHIPTARYVGIDVAKDAINSGKEQTGLDLRVAEYSTFVADDQYSDIFMWDVIEHLQFPRAYLEKIHGDTADSARVYITTGDISGLLPRLQKGKWRMIHPPTHIHYFSAKSLTKLLESTGFEVQSVTYPWISRSVKQIFYSLFMLNKPESKIKRFVYRLIPNFLAIKLNTFDIMFVIAQKK